MKQVFNYKGNIIVKEVPSPNVSPGEVLVEVFYSCISTGTEISVLGSSRKSLIKKVLEKPENLGKALDIIKDKGLVDSFFRISKKFEKPGLMGYSASGIIKEIGKGVFEFKIGDRVACAGAGLANHAEYISVPKNLVVKIPEGLSMKNSSTAALGAISLQGVRRCDAKIGEYVVVLGLGMLGIITVQLLNLSGCRIIGIDLEQRRIDLAKSLGLYIGLDAKSTDLMDRVIEITNGYGADAVIVTAASINELLINQAVKFCRRKGKIVVVGDVKLNINREEFYKRELDLLISTSYGPGRYDDKYELLGFEYPYSYVRWSENRNIKEYIQLLSENKVKVDSLIEKFFPIEKATDAYLFLKSEKKPLSVILEYQEEKEYEKKLPISLEVITKELTPKKEKSKKTKLNTGIIGAGSFTQEMHLPNLNKLKDIFNIYAISCKEGYEADYLAKSYNAKYSTTDYLDIINDSNIDAVLITTRHNLHAKIAMEVSNSGKAIFVEKPMALNNEELEELVGVLQKNNSIFTVGFNRRFSPFLIRAKGVISDRIGPLIVNYRMNAGFIPKEHWVHTEEGGGRNIGEACHIYDIFNFLTNSEVKNIDAVSIDTNFEQFCFNDNFITTIKYNDGSVCNLVYTSIGGKTAPKEQMDIYFDEKVLNLNDYKELNLYNNKSKTVILKGRQDKGHYNELNVFGQSILNNNYENMIPLWQMVQATKISFEVEEKLRK